MMLTLQQKIYLIQCYGKGDNSYRQVIQEFNEKYPGVHVAQSSLHKIVQKFLSTGSLLKKQRQKKIYDENDASTVLVLQSVNEHPKMSLRRRSEYLGVVKKSHIQKILKQNKILPYKPIFRHTLEGGDEAKRLDFCLWIGGMERNFHQQIMFSDESIFSTNGIVASQHSRYWSADNPHYRIPSRRQYYKKVNVWCAVSYHGIIGPYFFEDTCNGNSYLNMLQTFFTNELENLPLAYRNSFYFQQDGCPAHCTVPVRTWLQDTFPNRWISRHGPYPWPPRCPDLSIMDFYLWGRLKQIVYSRPLDNNLYELKERIEETVQSIPLEEVRRAYNELLARLQLCAEADGGLFE